MPPPRKGHNFVRISNPSVAWQPMVRDDSRFAILPVMPPAEIKGWTVYDSATGQVIVPPSGFFRSYVDARNWLNEEYPE